MGPLGSDSLGTTGAVRVTMTKYGTSSSKVVTSTMASTSSQRVTGLSVKSVPILDNGSNRCGLDPPWNGWEGA